MHQVCQWSNTGAKESSRPVDCDLAAILRCISHSTQIIRNFFGKDQHGNDTCSGTQRISHLGLEISKDLAMPVQSQVRKILLEQLDTVPIHCPFGCMSSDEYREHSHH